MFIGCSIGPDVEGRGGERVFQGGQLVEQRSGQGLAKLGGGRLDMGPQLALGADDQRLAGGGEADGLVALVRVTARCLDEAGLGQASDVAGDAGLAGAHRFDKLAHGEGTVQVERRQQRKLAGLDVEAKAVAIANHIGLQSLADPLEPAAQAEVTELSNDIFHRVHSSDI
jgi:hypothetical protein